MLSTLQVQCGSSSGSQVLGDFKHSTLGFDGNGSGYVAQVIVLVQIALMELLSSSAMVLCHIITQCPAAADCLRGPPQKCMMEATLNQTVDQITGSDKPHMGTLSGFLAAPLQIDSSI